MAVIWGGIVFHEYVYGGKPALTVAVAVPSFPAHETGVLDVLAVAAFKQSKKSMKTPESKIGSPASAIANLKW